MQTVVRLGLEPYWLDLDPGLRVLVEAPGSVAWMIARDAAWRAMRAAAGPESAEEGDLAEVQDDAWAEGQVAFAIALAQRSIKAWEGVGDADGQPIEPTPERVAQLLKQHGPYEAFHREYVKPVLEREAEKNVSSLSSNGAGKTRATATAGNAGTKTEKPARAARSKRTSPDPTPAG
jgi:hypothetical protein